MFKPFNRIPNDGAPSYVNELCFDPGGKTFAATFEHKNEVRIFDAETLSLIRVLRNPTATLNRPHGVLATRKHLIVANKGTSPCQFHVFRLDDDSGSPIQTYTTPYPHLAEGHSIARNGRRLVISYCEGRGKKGALVSYDYDDETGRIIGPLDIQEDWFRRHGDAKGVSFDGPGARVYVTFQSDLVRKRATTVEDLKILVSRGHRGATSRNGIAVFGIDQRGRFTRRPLQKRLFRRFCRLENIHVRGDCAVVTNADNGSVQLYDLCDGNAFKTPLQVLERFVFPHGAKMSPDGTLLVVTDNGIEVSDHQVHWKRFVSPRQDGLVVFKLEAA